MNRRKFISVSTASIACIPLAGLTAYVPYASSVPGVKPAWLIKLIGFNDEELQQMAAYKIKDPAAKYAGGYMNDAAIPNPHSTCAFINRAAVAVSSPESSFYHSGELLNDIQKALQSLLQMQHTDGTIDLLDTNFHSTPDTAFMVKRLMQSYYLLHHADIKNINPVSEPFERFLKNAGEALITGGIHTPNHRWVVSAALTKLYEHWPDPRYLKRINDWLAEHIDLDPDGQYTEKSTAGYSAVVDRVLITVAKGLHKPEIYEAVRKNILMMRYYLHPNGEVVTEASNRQDKGTIGTMEGYYYACRYMSLMDNDGEMAAICRLIEKTSFRKLTDALGYLLEDPSLWKELPADTSLPVSYVKSFPYSGVVRIRRNQWDATILSNNPGWLTFHKTNVALQGIRLAASFFGKGQFQSDEIKQEGNKWILTRKLDGPYYQPFPKDKIPADGDMAKMPKSMRTQSNIQYLETTVVIYEATNGITVDISMSGTDGVPVSLELIFRKGGSFTGVEPASRNDAFLLAGKEGTYTSGNETIRFGPGKMEHKGIQLRGALPAMDAPSVYITGFTPFTHTLTLS